MIRLTFGILVIIASWLFQIPLPWAITLTVFSAFVICGAVVSVGRRIAELGEEY